MVDDSREQTPFRRRLIYRGRVQGVGFRYTVVSLARRYPVAGYVKNLPDGTVELAVEGQAGPTQAFLKEVDQALYGYIDDCLAQELDPGEEFSGFEIRY